ncbi:hypothetical protein KSP40_PGU003116 [Platanthera guangdongensis]|uniref:Uncharacterized protein n=1 Tax=Platanthera guangdongensis TaxID=2320717 RepID=A0ABR2N2A6_9ASPA
MLTTHDYEKQGNGGAQLRETGGWGRQLWRILRDSYVERVLTAEKEKMRCCQIEYNLPKRSSQAFIYGGILVAGFAVYFLVIFFSSPVR